MQQQPAQGRRSVGGEYAAEMRFRLDERGYRIIVRQPCGITVLTATLQSIRSELWLERACRRLLAESGRKSFNKHLDKRVDMGSERLVSLCRGLVKGLADRLGPLGRRSSHCTPHTSESNGSRARARAADRGAVKSSRAGTQQPPVVLLSKHATSYEQIRFAFPWSEPIADFEMN